MTQTTTIDLGHVARDLNLPPEKVARTVDLLDEGNTVPFITRYRKDLTGGLDEEQIRAIQHRVGKIRQLAERKATILKTIEAQGQLAPELAEQIRNANTPKRLEDLYLPFKPKKQTLATIARERGLEPLAIEIYEALPAAADLTARAATFIAPDKEVNTVQDVLAGVGHLIAERFSENAELRGRLRRIFQRSGRIVCSKVEPPAAAPPQGTGDGGQGTGVAGREGEAPAEPPPQESAARGQESGDGGQESAGQRSEVRDQGTELGGPRSEEPQPSAVASSDQVLSTQYLVPSTSQSSDFPDTNAATVPFVPLTQLVGQPEDVSSAAETSPPLPLSPPPALTSDESQEPASTADAPQPPASSPEPPPAEALPTGRLFEVPQATATPPIPVADLKRKKKKKKKVIGEHAFKDYYNYSEPLSRLPPHRVLAINRGERARAIRVKIEADTDAMLREAELFLLRPNEQHLDFLRGCVHDALTRLIVPSLEREIRREITERAEEHAVEVFIRNLRKLLLQPPSRGRRVLAIDPGFKSGSKIVALDEFGNVLGHGMIFVIGKDEERRKKARTRLADMVKQYNISVVAIGNGTGCRETEQLVADCLADELKDQDVAYVIVNEAGASIYSTSPLGREELPQFDALQRGAISIGRRLLDPLSEMVKIHPANLGVGLYQHDIKARHLKDSLDGVVESCVNFVGVDVNSASPALLRYVSGMNALTARRVYEHRREKGPFKNRDELKQVPGFGEQTFVQAAGFLKIIGGENPLDATWIHPESYDIARRVLDKIGCDVAELAKVVPAPAQEEPKKEFAAELAAEKGTGDKGQGTGGMAREGEAPAEPQGSEVSAQGAGQTPASADSLPPSVLSTEYSVPSTQQPGDSPDTNAATVPFVPLAQLIAKPEPPECSPPLPLSPSPAQSISPPPAPSRSIAERAASVDVQQLAAELSVGTHLLEDILASLTRPALDPRDNLPPPIFRRGIMKLEDLSPGMELSGTVLNVVDFGVFVDIGLSDSGLVHISRLADRFIRDPHEVVGVGDVLKVWVVEVDKARRRVSLTAIAPGTERPPRPPRERQRDQRPSRPPRQQQGRPPRQPQGGPPQPQQLQAAAQPAGASAPSPGQRPPRPYGGGRRDQGRGGRPQQQHPKSIERRPTKPKPVKPITKAMEEGREPMRSFSDLMQLYDKKKEKPKGEEPPPPPSTA